jgi:transcriptional regulator with GAF, ATPase, and Fis domain
MTDHINNESLIKANKILKTTLEITEQIILDNKEIDIKKIFERIGTELDIVKIFLLRFPMLDSNYIEWIKPGFESTQNYKKNLFDNEHDNYDISQLLEWVYTGNVFCISIDHYPTMFKVIVRTVNIEKYYKILVPIIIKNKPWGIMGIGQVSDQPIDLLTESSLVGLCKLISLVIKQGEEKEKINAMIDQKIIEFKQRAKIKY